VTCRRTLQSPLGLTFFGLNLEYRKYLFDQLHEIVFYGKGGYDWNTVYNMPIWLRNLTFVKIKEYYEKENNPNNGGDVISQNRKTLQSSGATPPPKNKVPSYVVKSPKK